MIRYSLAVALWICVLSACSKQPIITPPHTEVVSSLDELYGKLAKRVVEQMGGDVDNFTVTQSFGAWSVGTVIRKDRTFPVSYSACRPPDADSEVASVDAPTLFPAYEMSRSIGANLGLNEAVLAGVAEVKASASQTRDVTMSVGDTKILLWSDDGLSGMLATKTCRDALVPGGTYRIIRGFVIGKRRFSFGAGVSAKGDAKLKVANFEVGLDRDGSTVSVVDAKPQAFLAMISEFTLPAAPNNSPQISALASQVGEQEGAIYLQRDEDADPRFVDKLVQNLRAAHFDVADGIEELPSDKMPAATQVRFFRDSDRVKALAVFKIVQAMYPGANLLQLNISAPEGQLEIWLSQSKSQLPVPPAPSHPVQGLWSVVMQCPDQSNLSEPNARFDNGLYSRGFTGATGAGRTELSMGFKDNGDLRLLGFVVFGESDVYGVDAVGIAQGDGRLYRGAGRFGTADNCRLFVERK